MYAIDSIAILYLILILMMILMMISIIPIMQTTIKVGDAFRICVAEGIFVQPAYQLSNSLDSYALSIATNCSTPYWMLAAVCTTRLSFSSLFSLEFS
jgi:hypothetical protein